MFVFRYLFTIIFLSFSLLLFSQLPNSDCNFADIFCNRESLQATTWVLPVMEPDAPTIVPNRLCVTSNGNINNPLYFGFIASSTNLSLRIIPLSFTPGPTGPNVGYQWAVFDGCDLQDPDWVLCDGDPQFGIVTINLTNLEVGHTYFLLLDGNEGSGMDFNIQVISGIPSVSNPFTVDEPDSFSNSLGDSWEPGDTIDICQNGFFTSSVLGVTNALEFKWATIDAEGNESILHIGADTLDFTFTEDSVYQICVTALTDCDDSEPACFFVNVLSEPEVALGTFEYCRPDLTAGVIPPGWEGDVITVAGLYQHTIKDTLTGCTHNQLVRVVSLPVMIGTLDSIHCGMDTVFFQNDTITVNFFEKQYILENMASNGCDSILNFTLNRIGFAGALSGYSCLGNGKFGIEINPTMTLPADFDSITVEWFKDLVHFTNSGTNMMQLEILDKGAYSAVVYVWKNGHACQFDIGPVTINELISSAFSLELDSICITDKVFVNINEVNSQAGYSFLNVDSQVLVSPGRYALGWNQPGDYQISLRVDFDQCNVQSNLFTVHVEEELIPPVVTCNPVSNQAFDVQWGAVDCAGTYEVYSDGVLITQTANTSYSFTGLEIGTAYDIEIRAITDCLCPSVSTQLVCSTNPCADNITVTIDPFDNNICLDEFTTELVLTGQANGSTGGTYSWSGAIISQDGRISPSGVQAGIYVFTLTYEIDNCPYYATEMLEIFPSVTADVTAEDISCYYNTDGEIVVVPQSGEAPYDLLVNQVPSDNFVLTGLDQGSYAIQLTDDNGCKHISTVVINRPKKPTISINGNTVIQRGENYEYLLKLDDLVYDSVLWYIQETDSVLCSGNCSEIEYEPLEDHHLCITVFYDEQCSVDTCIQIIVNSDFSFFVPNVFSPYDQDGVNDYFMVKTNSYRDLRIVRFSVYDRWGEHIFEEKNILFNRKTGDRTGWDGYYHGQALIPGVYIYYLEIEDSNGEIHKMAGDITLLR